MASNVARTSAGIIARRIAFEARRHFIEVAYRIDEAEKRWQWDLLTSRPGVTVRHYDAAAITRYVEVLS